MLLEHLPTPSPPLPSLLIRRYSYPRCALANAVADLPPLKRRHVIREKISGGQQSRSGKPFGGVAVGRRVLNRQGPSPRRFAAWR